MSTLSPSGLKLVDGLGSPGQALDDNFTLLNASVGLQAAAVGITGLTGGGATKLDGLETTSLDAGAIIAVYNGSSVKPYRFRAGTDAENSPYIIRPDDYAGGTHEFVWELMGVWGENFVGTASNWSVVGGSTWTLPTFSTGGVSFTAPLTRLALVAYSVHIRFETTAGKADLRVQDTTAATTLLAQKSGVVEAVDDQIVMADIQPVQLVKGNTIELQARNLFGSTGDISMVGGSNISFVLLG